MEASVVLSCLSVALAFAAAVFAMRVISAGVRRVTAASSVGGARRGRVAWLVRNGVRWFRPAACVFLQFERVRSLAAEAVLIAGARGFVATEESLLSTFATVVLLLAGCAGVISASPVGALAVGACTCVLAAAWVSGVQDRRREAVRDAVPDALRSMGVCFQAGLSLLQTFQQTATEVQGPLRALFERAAHQLEIGQSTQQALATFRSAAAVPELAFVAVALDVQHEAGGSLKQVLDSARDTVEGELELKRSLRVQTAQAKLSARVVSVLPFVLIALFSLISEDFLAPFFASFSGMALLAVALAMQAAGIVLVRRMLAVEVS